MNMETWSTSSIFHPIGVISPIRVEAEESHDETTPIFLGRSISLGHLLKQEVGGSMDMNYVIH
jgi:hypothetical protein